MSVSVEDARIDNTMAVYVLVFVMIDKCRARYLKCIMLNYGSIRNMVIVVKLNEGVFG